MKALKAELSTTRKGRPSWHTSCTSRLCKRHLRIGIVVRLLKDANVGCLRFVAYTSIQNAMFTVGVHAKCDFLQTKQFWAMVSINCLQDVAFAFQRTHYAGTPKIQEGRDPSSWILNAKMQHQYHERGMLHGLIIPSAISKIVFRHILFFNSFLMQFGLWRASAVVSSLIHLFVEIFALEKFVCVIIFYYARWQHKNKKNSSIMKNIHYRRKSKRKTIKSKAEYAIRASPNGPLNIYVADMPWKNMIDRKQSLGLIQTKAICKRLRTMLVLRSLIIKIIFLWCRSNETGIVPTGIKNFAETIIPCNVKFMLVGIKKTCTKSRSHIIQETQLSQTGRVIRVCL